MKTQGYLVYLSGVVVGLLLGGGIAAVWFTNSPHPSPPPPPLICQRLKGEEQIKNPDVLCCSGVGTKWEHSFISPPVLYTSRAYMSLAYHERLRPVAPETLQFGTGARVRAPAPRHMEDYIDWDTLCNLDRIPKERLPKELR